MSLPRRSASPGMLASSLLRVSDQRNVRGQEVRRFRQADDPQQPDRQPGGGARRTNAGADAARTLGDNRRAARLPTHLGFQPESLLRQRQYYWGRFRDGALLGVLALDSAAMPSDAVSTSRPDKL